VLKCPVAVAKQNADALAWILIRNGNQVYIAVIIEIARADNAGAGRYGGLLRPCAEGPVAVAEEDYYVVCIDGGADYREIEIAVVVEVAAME